ncbi:unnamed protein product [Discosporangium mesarthrocarpum]
MCLHAASAVLKAPTEDFRDRESTVHGERSALGGDREGGSDYAGSARLSQVSTPSQGCSRGVSQEQGSAKGKMLLAASTSANKGITLAGGETVGADELSTGCGFPHKHKGKTAPRIANPKARWIPPKPYDPILANKRWPPPVDVPPSKRTEYLRNFSWDHSIAACTAPVT